MLNQSSSLTGVAGNSLGDLTKWRDLVSAPTLGGPLDTVAEWQSLRGSLSVDSLVERAKASAAQYVGEALASVPTQGKLLTDVVSRIDWLY